MKAVVCALTVLLSLGLFLTIFFACGPYSVIQDDLEWASALCLTTNSTVHLSYCPTVQCSTCSSTSIGTPSCGDVHSHMVRLNPARCAQNHTNQCAVSHYCGGEPNFNCSVRVEEVRCIITPVVCYTAQLTMDYTDRTRRARVGAYHRDFHYDELGAKLYTTTERVAGYEYPCFYDTSNTSSVLWDLPVSYSTVMAPFVISMVLAFLVLFSCGCCVDGLLVKCVPTDDMFKHRAAQIFLWGSVVIPLAILMPVSMAPNLTSEETFIEQLVMCQLVALGALPLFVCVGSEPNVVSQDHLILWSHIVKFAYMVMWYLPIGLLVPLRTLVDSEHTGELLIACVLVSLVGVPGMLWGVRLWLVRR